MGTGDFNAGSNPAIQGGVDKLLVASCCRNRDKLRPDGPRGSYADLTLRFARCKGVVTIENVTRVLDFSKLNRQD